MCVCEGMYTGDCVCVVGLHFHDSVCRSLERLQYTPFVRTLGIQSSFHLSVVSGRHPSTPVHTHEHMYVCTYLLLD